jgi:hypothetical protein
MFKFITNMFTQKPVAPVAETPYKIEAPVKAEVKKPAVKKATTAKPRKPKTPKA